VNLVLLSSLAFLTIGAIPEGTELQFSGSLTPQGRTVGETKNFQLTAVAWPTDDGSSQLAWVLEERGAGGWAWPERFGVVTLVPSEPSQPIRVLHTHDGLPHPIGVRSPLFEAPDKLSPESSWSDGRLEYRVARRRKFKERDCWHVDVASNLGRAQTLLIDADLGIVVSAEQRVFMGRGDEFLLKYELQSQKVLPPAELVQAQTAFAALRQLQSGLGRTGEQKVLELTEAQLKSAQDHFRPAEPAAKGTPWAKLAGVIGRDLQQQQQRLAGAAGLAQKFLDQPAPKLSLKRADGTALPAGELQDKVVVLHFWEYRHENLMEPYGQIGYLDFLNGKRKKLGVKVVGINVLPDADASGAGVRSMRKLVEFMNLGYDVAVDDGTALGQFGDPRALGSPLPLWVVLGHDGKVLHYHIGYYNITPDEGLKQLDAAVLNALRRQRETQE